jgi:predicted GIY-YIG superfamily endonuclease
MTLQNIVSDITDYVGTDTKSTWYVGIATNAKNRLFNDHSVDEKNGKWMYRTVDSESAARAAEKSLHDLGFDGGTGGGDASTKMVYA